MDRFRKTFSVRKKKEPEATDSSKPQLWMEDEKKIKEGSCNFQVKYLGCIEVFESRGMQVCEEAIKALRKSKKKTQRAILYVSGDALRVSDEISKHLIVDQTIEKVSFCAPDRCHDKGFAYICRDGATRRWMCHAFLSVKESGERLSHAVGCAFAICLERKQKRERDAVQATYANEDGTLARISSFRQASLSERLIDPQSAIVVNHNIEAPSKSRTSEIRGDSGAIVPFDDGLDKTSTLLKQGSGAIPRPRASPSLIERQTSLRLFPKLQETSPFKHTFSMRTTVATTSSLQRRNIIANGETIPEETATELEATPTTNHSRDPTKSPLGRTSQASQPAIFAFRNPLISGTTKVSPTFPVSFDEINSSSTEVREEIDNLVAIDPFSAAPFNPATIQQHQVAQQQQLQSRNHFSSNSTSLAPPRKVSPVFTSASAAPQVLNATPFPVSEWPDDSGDSAVGVNVPFHSVPLPRNTQVVSDSQHLPGGNTSHLDASSLSCLPSSPITTQSAVSSSNMVVPFGKTIKYPHSLAEPSTSTAPIGILNTQWSSTVSGPTVTAPTSWVPEQLPSDSTGFGADPFDLGWAERATAMAKGQLEAWTSSSTISCLPVTTPLPSTSHSSPVCTNPFLAPLSYGER